MELKNNLITICKERNITLSTLSKISGVHQSTLHGWSTGRSVQNLDDLRKVCLVLEIGLYTLLYGTHDPFELKEVILEEIFKGDVRITVHRLKSKS